MNLPPLEHAGRTAFVNEVGSGMWGMSSFTSDVDLIVVFIYPTMKILRGHFPHKTLPQRRIMHENIPFDVSYFEVGHILYLLSIGNINAIWAATSPVTHIDGMWRERISMLTVNLLSKQSYLSINGMALSQLRDARKILDGRPSEKVPDEDFTRYQKKLNTSMRTINFGINLLSKGEVHYRQTKVSDFDEHDIETRLEELRYAYMRSSLPEYPDIDRFGDLLYSIRMHDLSIDSPSTAFKLGYSDAASSFGQIIKKHQIEDEK